MNKAKLQQQNMQQILIQRTAPTAWLWLAL